MTSSHKASWKQPVVLALGLLFLAKALFLGFFVIPPADTPDESGHYAYVHDIADGEFFPLLNKAEIPNNLFLDVPLDPDRHRPNYIAQHPPLYYAVAAIPLWITQQFTDDRWYLVRIVRSVSGVSMALLFIAMFALICQAGARQPTALLVSAAIMFIPMLGNLSAGITNDIFLFLLCTVACNYLVQFSRRQELRSAYLCALWLTLAGGTKMTAWPLIGLALPVIAYEMSGTWRQWFKHMIGVSVLASLLPAWWALRNLYHFGDMLKVNAPVDATAVDPGYSMWQYLVEQPFFDWMMVHFYGLFGFSGYCQSVDKLGLCKGVLSTRVANEAFEFFVGVLLLCALLFLWNGLARIKHQVSGTPPGPVSATPVQAFLWRRVTGRQPAMLALLGILMALGISALYLGIARIHHEPGYVGFVAMTVMLMLFPIAALYLWLLPIERDTGQRIVAYSIVMVFVFGIVFATQAYKGYMLTGALKGIQGRYFYPFIPLLAASLALLLERARIPLVIILWITLGLAYGELFTYITQIIPFFQEVRL